MAKDKRPIRKARRAKVKTEIDRWRETVYAQLLDLDKRVSSIEETLAELVIMDGSEDREGP